ncbi:MAG: signal recognition particle-docking protein FtsY [Bdellovibrionales bacterium]|nr:signal recognition particle-docking protein FtsY [Bdellovibrionales bacterium]
MNWSSKIRSFFYGTTPENVWTRDELEALLYQSDLSSGVIQDLLSHVGALDRLDQKTVLEKLYQETSKRLSSVCNKPWSVQTPSVILLVGINGSGKTTTAARLGFYLKNQSHNVVLAAGDTFRAGAIDQLQTWAQRLDLPCVFSDYKSDPASVIYEGWQKAKSQDAVLIADTAGRLHTQTPLMEQLSKIKRVLLKDLNITIQTLLVLDGTNGQNALMQSKHFKDEIEIDGLIMTKLDGSSKGGAVISSALELKVPIYFVGVGEKETDLVEFQVEPFLRSFYGI